MTLIQRYKSLAERTPKKDSQIILYKRPTLHHKYRRFSSDPMQFNYKDAAGACVLTNLNGGMVVITEREKYLFQWVYHKELNKMQHWFGELYLGLPAAIVLFYILIRWIVTLF